MQSLDDFCFKIKNYDLKQENIEIISYTSKFQNVQNEISLVDTFSNIKLFPRIYWSNNEDGSIIGFGSIKEYISSNFDYKKLDKFIYSIRKSTLSNLENLEMVKIFGGIAFNQLTTNKIGSDEWAKFPNTYFSLPNIIISKLNKEIFITINLKLSQIGSNSIKEEFNNLLTKIESYIVYSVNTETKKLKIQIKAENTSQSLDEWRDNIYKIKELIHNSSLEKLVLANSKIINLSELTKISHSLYFLHKNYSNAYVIALEIEEFNIFISATPELLVKKAKGKLLSDAIAGSRPRGINHEEDLILENDLLQSNKDQKEHKFVVEQIIKKFRDTGIQNIYVDEAYVVKLKNIQHLKAEISADCDKSIPELIHILHPTAAVGGVPSDQALNNILLMEKMDRGWYAGPLGWLTSEGNGKVAVAIRSVLVKDLTAILYAGAGIVADSDADAEWKEIGVKFQPMLRALGVENYNSQ